MAQATPTPADGAAKGLGAVFDLTAAETETLEEACAGVLAPLGVDASRFFARLRAGDAFGPALGVTAEIGELLYAKAHRWFAVGRAERAEPIFRALCVAFPADADYWVGYGVCLRLHDDIGGARLAFATAGNLRPDWAVPPFHACELALRAGDTREAERLLNRFETLRDAQTPEPMVAEAARLDQALRFRRATAAGGGRP